MRDEFKLDNWNRRFLPHYDASYKIQLITYRLADRLPSEVKDRILEVKFSSASSDTEIRKYIEEYLDTGFGNCLLSKREHAQTVIDNWKYFDGKKYDLIAWVVMPNHVHLLIKTGEAALSSIVHSWKSYTSHIILKTEKEKDPEFSMTSIWQREYWDRFIRDEKHFNAAINYIHNNPVKAGLVESPEKWEFSSAAE